MTKSGWDEGRDLKPEHDVLDKNVWALHDLARQSRCLFRQCGYLAFISQLTPLKVGAVVTRSLPALSASVPASFLYLLLYLPSLLYLLMYLSETPLPCGRGQSTLSRGTRLWRCGWEATCGLPWPRTTSRSASSPCPWTRTISCRPLRLPAEPLASSKKGLPPWGASLPAPHGNIEFLTQKKL